MSEETVSEETAVNKPRVIVLIATIPTRLRSCERLLAEISRQSHQPDGVILVLDGYGENPAPACSLPLIASYRTVEAQGAGSRWRAAFELPPEDVLICIDDDMVLFEAPHFIKNLVAAVEAGDGAAAAAGKGVDNKFAPPGQFSRGDLIYAAGCGFAVRAKHLTGLEAFANELKTAGGPDCLGKLGDDDALVSAFLWKNKVKIRHAATGNIYSAPGMRTSSQTAARSAKRENPDAQKIVLQRMTGWPWVAPAAPQVRR